MAKIQIRRGVFETNSSSTHSLQITNLREQLIEKLYNQNPGINGENSTTLDDVMNDLILKEVLDFQRDHCYDGDFENLDELLKNDVLSLRGLCLETGDERRTIVYFIKSPLRRLQFLIAYIYYEIQAGSIKFVDIKDELLEYAQKYISSDIKHIVLDEDNGISKVWSEYCKVGKENWNDESIRNNIHGFIKGVLNPENIIKFGDYAYSSDGLKIYEI